MASKPLIKESLFFLNSCGINPANQNLKREILAGIVTIFVIYFIIELTLGLVLKWKGWNSVDEMVAYSGFILVLIKIIVMMVQSGKIRRLLKLLKKFWSWKDYGSDLQNKIEDIFKLIKKLMIIYSIGPVICLTAYTFKPLFTVRRTLPFQTYHPSDYNKFYNYYQAIYGLELINFLIAFTTMYGFDYLFLSFITHIICECKILKNRILNIKTENDDLTEVKPLVKHHNLILKCVKKLDNIYSMLLLVQFLFSLITLCTGLLNIIVNGPAQNFNRLLINIGYVGACLGQLLIYCVAGAYLKAETESITDAVYKSDWWIKTQPELRRAYTLIIQRAQKGEELTAGGMFNLNLISFTKILKTSMSFFMLVKVLFTKSRSE